MEIKVKGRQLQIPVKAINYILLPCTFECVVVGGQ